MIKSKIFYILFYIKYLVININISRTRQLYIYYLWEIYSGLSKVKPQLHNTLFIVISELEDYGLFS